MKKVLICAFQYDQNCKEGKQLLTDNNIEVIENPKMVPFTRDELKKMVIDVDGVITGNEVWDEELYKLAPKLKVIARFGIGVDNIDIEAAKKYGIKVCNAPCATNGVAELVIGWIIMLLRNLVLGNQICKAGMWNRCFGMEVRGKKIGLIGYGRIPKLISKKLMNFEADVYAFDQCPDIEYARDHNVTLTSMEYILENCDIISLHLPATPATRNIMNEKAFQSMKKGAFFLNTSRGSLVDEDALYEALASNHLGGAACDVFAIEPIQADNKLLQLNNFICTPHWGSDTKETVSMVGKMTAEQIIAVLCHNQIPSNCLNS